jgi:hypothetical protein
VVTDQLLLEEQVGAHTQVTVEVEWVEIQIDSKQTAASLRCSLGGDSGY